MHVHACILLYSSYRQIQSREGWTMNNTHTQCNRPDIQTIRVSTVLTFLAIQQK